MSKLIDILVVTYNDFVACYGIKDQLVSLGGVFAATLLTSADCYGFAVFFCSDDLFVPIMPT